MGKKRKVVPEPEIEYKEFIKEAIEKYLGSFENDSKIYDWCEKRQRSEDKHGRKTRERWEALERERVGEEDND